MKVYLVGIGMGNPATLTLAARDALSVSGLVVGAPRMLDCVRDLLRLAPNAGEEPASAAAAGSAPEAPAAPGVP
ncbi:SAM-dependent methyltransferase, partial [Atopobiaceae bacterium HCP3S3_D6]